MCSLINLHSPGLKMGTCRPSDQRRVTSSSVRGPCSGLRGVPDEPDEASIRIPLLIVSNYIQRYSPPLTGVIAGENKGVIPHVLRAVWRFGVMC